MSAGSTKIRGALRRAKGLVITTGYRVWHRLPLRMRMLAKKLAGKLPKPVLAKLQSSTGMQVPVKKESKPAFTAAEMLSASARPQLSTLGHGQEKPTRLYIGPIDRAGQAAALAPALGQAGLETHTVQHAEQDIHGLEVNRKISAAVAQASEEWQRAELDWVANNFSHALSVGGRALFGELFNRSAALVEAELLRGHGVRTGFLLSDGVRLSQLDRLENPHSAFAVSGVMRSERAEKQTKRLVRQLRELDLPLFVDTPDLLGSLPEAFWLPTVVPAGTPAANLADLPAVNPTEPTHLTTPTNPANPTGPTQPAQPTDPAGPINTADPQEPQPPLVVQLWANDGRSAQQAIAQELEQLAKQGCIIFKKVNQLRLAEVRQVVSPGTVVIDDLQLGSYSVAAAHAMSRGGVLISNITELNRTRIAQITDVEFPAKFATPANAAEAIAQVLTDEADRSALAAAALQYADQVHSGTLSAQLISRHLLRSSS